MAEISRYARRRLGGGVVRARAVWMRGPPVGPLRGGPRLRGGGDPDRAADARPAEPAIAPRIGIGDQYSTRGLQGLRSAIAEALFAPFRLTAEIGSAYQAYTNFE
jgi:hypothetical protein